MASPQGTRVVVNLASFLVAFLQPLLLPLFIQSFYNFSLLPTAAFTSVLHWFLPGTGIISIAYGAAMIT
jgi:hypothetical protein